MVELEGRVLEELFTLRKHRSKNGGKISCSIQNWLITFRIVKTTTFGVIGFFFSYKTKAICIQIRHLCTNQHVMSQSMNLNE